MLTKTTGRSTTGTGDTELAVQMVRTWGFFVEAKTLLVRRMPKQYIDERHDDTVVIHDLFVKIAIMLCF